MPPQRPGNPSHQRVTAEKSHYEAQRVAFTCPLTIVHVPGDTSGGAGGDDDSEGQPYALGLPTPPPTYPGINPYDATPPPAGPMSQLSKEDALSFCLKDSIIYGNYNDSDTHTSSSSISFQHGRHLQSPEQDRLTLLDAVYTTWFPHRALAPQDMHLGNFWGKYLRFQNPAGVRLDQILAFHRQLCDMLKSTLNTTTLTPSSATDVSTAMLTLRKTLPLVFIVLERNWRDEGVLLVWKTEGIAKRYGCWEGEGMRKFVCGDGSNFSHGHGQMGMGMGMGPPRVFRCSLERAMKAVLELDPERAKVRREWSVVCGRVLG